MIPEPGKLLVTVFTTQSQPNNPCNSYDWPIKDVHTVGYYRVQSTTGKCKNNCNRMCYIRNRA